ncbi:5'-methylthioadenosine/adenosylhomocysteine nucleosidase [Treponema sp.]|uniref:5'-methylthioadenosine/adenosylhomocysteine nucleosidase n=1 Tax=Treponema sp. TaxID=166 RepID=UPI0025FDEEFF|nr:5'-methylthioadenosine/adenosylhomocysteine nucleosidase [Treponema sp.]MCR5217455.1 5'-methylthioadenosine/adenosylhomocysteine nucleosidase [Treponema sp.]
MQNKIGIIGAMNVEVKTLKSLLENSTEKKSMGLTFVEGKLDGKDVVIVQSGIGKVNAALCTQILICEFKVTHIINTGIAGAMAHGLKVLDFVVSTDALYHDMDATGFGYKATEIPQMECSDFAADAAMIVAAKEAFASLKEAEGHSLMAGRIASGDQFVSSKEIKARIKAACDPACVEMEGAAIAHAAYLYKTPFVIIRCMSDMADDAGESTYDFNEESAANLSAALVRAICGRI